VDQETDQPLDPQLEAILPVLRDAHDHHQAGRLDEAAALYEKVLLEVPGLGDPLHLLGQIALARGQAQRAVELISQAIDDLPEGFAEPYLNLGNAYAALGQPRQAIANYRQAIANDPGLAVAHANLARMLNLTDHFEAALESCRTALRLNPALIEAHLNLAVALRSLRRDAEAEEPLRQALALKPDRAETLNDLATLLRELRRYQDAVPLHESAIAMRPDDAAMCAAFGATLFRMNQVPRALPLFRHAVALAPDLAEVWVSCGIAERAAGLFDEAERCFRRAIAIQPDLSAAHWNLAYNERQSADSEEARRLETLFTRPDTPAADRIAAGFALGKIFDDADRFEQAFPLFAEANAMFRRMRAETGEMFDAAAFERHVAMLISEFTPDCLRRVANWGNPSELPVFVVGMPRSGTTLVEQIAASHSQVFGAGELREIGELLREMMQRNQGTMRVADWNPADARELADRHIELLRGLGGSALRVVDKVPDNILVLGQIAALFPGARVIHVKRDPRDCALSNFFQFYSHGNLFACDLRDSGVRARETLRLGGHWRDVLPLNLLEVEYEALVADLDGQSRRLIEFLGLDWEPACLEFHKTERVVTTPSAWQVRQPIYSRSVGRWRHYQRHLGALFAGLGAEA
jgi:tetratricopeptide (TPR) repeat protein